MFYPYYNSTDNFSVAFSFRKVVSANLGPENLCTVKYLESMCIIDFYFVVNVGAVNDGNVIPMARLHKVDSLVKIQRLIHDNYIVKSTNKSQIKS